MNKEELRNKFIEHISDKGYGYNDEEKKLRIEMHDFLVQILTDYDYAKKLNEMFDKNLCISNPCPKYLSFYDENTINEFNNFEKYLLHNSILDDADLYFVTDLKSGKQYFCDIYDFRYDGETTKNKILKPIDTDADHIELKYIDGWSGLEFFNKILKEKIIGGKTNE